MTSPRPSPLQNRVTPDGEIVATPARGAFMGNRGIIHDPATRTLLTRRWQHRAWICCRLEWKDHVHPIMGPGAYTELFFLDEATALAAGHRPCAYCRRGDFERFKRAWSAAVGAPDARAAGIDRRLHAERVTRRREKVTFEARASGLPDGSFVRDAGRACLVWRGGLRAWTVAGYGAPEPLPGGTVAVLTPRSVVGALDAGYAPALHPEVD